MMAEKLTVAVLFGGQSSEHEVSCISVQTIVKSMDKEKYTPVLVGITKEGHWVYVESLEDIASGAWRSSKVSAILSPDATEKCLIVMEDDMVKSLNVFKYMPSNVEVYPGHGPSTTVKEEIENNPFLRGI